MLADGPIEILVDLFKLRAKRQDDPTWLAAAMDLELGIRDARINPRDNRRGQFGFWCGSVDHVDDWRLQQCFRLQGAWQHDNGLAQQCFRAMGFAVE